MIGRIYEYGFRNIDEIKRLIPHRYPFLLVDKVIDIVKISLPPE